MNYKRLHSFCTLVALFSCGNPIKKVTNQVNSDLPSELKNRFYNKDLVGSYIKNPEDILGKLVYVFKINDSTMEYKFSVLRYPNNLGTIKRSDDPVLRASGVIEFKNSNEVGLFLSAFNLNSGTSYNEAAEIVVIDNRQVSINGDTIQSYFSNKPVLPKETITRGTTIHQPEIIYYVRGVDITSVSAKSARSFSNSVDASGAFFKMNNKLYSANSGFTFDYKAGLTVDDITSYVKGDSAVVQIPKEVEQKHSVFQTLIRRIPLDKIKKLTVGITK